MEVEFEARSLCIKITSFHLPCPSSSPQKPLSDLPRTPAARVPHLSALTGAVGFTCTLAILCATLSPAQAQPTPSPCPAGERRRSPSGACRLCRPGTYRQHPVGISEHLYSHCRPCAAGMFQPHAGAVDPDRCRPCPENIFSATHGAAACTACPTGTASRSGWTGCARCRAGSTLDYLSDRAAACRPFNSGSYNDIPVGASSCKQCPDLSCTRPPRLDVALRLRAVRPGDNMQVMLARLRPHELGRRHLRQVH